MRLVSKSKRSLLVICSIAIALVLLVQCVDKQEAPKNEIKNMRGEVFAGSVACAQCHKAIYDSHMLTAHYNTSAPASGQSIKGNFNDGINRFVFSPDMNVTMEKRDTDYYQVQYTNGMEMRRQKFDIAIGSGTKGQSYAYWNGNKLSQMPLFYYAAKNEWANSPGFPGQVIYSRPITSRCMECHSTFARVVSEVFVEPEEFDHNQMILGVDCEKCHGAGEKHVEYQLQNPDVKTAKYIVNPASLSRTQNLNLCALCHGGRMIKTVPSFSFEVGDTLANYFIKDTAAKDTANIDVHGNQFGLLAASKCFKMSGMTCTTCHNTHLNQRGMEEMFSQKCMSCHNEQHNNFCKLASQIGTTITKNCIDCHMPVQSSKAIVFLEQGATNPATASMRSHYIRIYPEEAKKYLVLLKRQDK
ncbi:MAG TPA: cytochrome c3 family protein [Panacibacter sp.]|nr:cytochrome c3 family protein [Panacibacter sp.]